jgi:DNA polymerase-3 subunit beta
MDFYITKEEIVSSLNTTLGVVEKRQTLPILANVLFEVDESTLRLTATDLESEISTISTISNFKSGGRTTVPAKKLSELCRLFKDNSEIHLYLDGNNLKIETDSGKYNLSTLPSEDFPVLKKEEGGNVVNISAPNLKTIISKTSFSMGNNQGWKDFLNGLYISIEDTLITSVATDTHRLAVAKTSLNEGVLDNITGIVPRKAINEIGKIVSESDENVLLNLSENSINVCVSGTNFTSKLIEGRFPDYKQVIPSGESSTLSINKKDLSESLSRVSILSIEKFRGVRLKTSENQINISANNRAKEQAEETIDCSYTGESIDIGFNVNYIQEILSSIDGETVEVHFFGSDNSCLITKPGSDDFKYVVMPLLY